MIQDPWQGCKVRLPSKAYPHRITRCQAAVIFPLGKLQATRESVAYDRWDWVTCHHEAS
jgi:hypothetical protein